MKRVAFAALLGLVLLAGCQNKDTTKKMADVDVCPKCTGTQHVTADGKCSGCGATVPDACPTCPGVQVKLADGCCSGCGKK